MQQTPERRKLGFTSVSDSTITPSSSLLLSPLKLDLQFPVQTTYDTRDPEMSSFQSLIQHLGQATDYDGIDALIRLLNTWSKDKRVRILKDKNWPKQATLEKLAQALVLDEHQALHTRTLELFELLCRGIDLGYPSPALAKALTWIVETILKESNCDTDSISTSFGSISLSNSVVDTEITIGDMWFRHVRLLAVLLKGNIGVKMFIKDIPHIKKFYKCLTMQLNSPDPTQSISSMTVLARLLLSDALGEKVFRSHNVHHAIDCILKVLQAPKSKYSSTFLIDCIDSLVEFGDVQFLPLLEQHDNLQATIVEMVYRVHLEEDETRILVATEFLSAMCKLSHRLRRDIAEQLVLDRKERPEMIKVVALMECGLHSDREIAISCCRLLLSIATDNQVIGKVLAGRSSKQTSEEQQRITLVLRKLLGCINILDIDSFRESDMPWQHVDDYVYAVEVYRLVNVLCNEASLSDICCGNLDLSRCAELIQLESSPKFTGATIDSAEQAPELSIAIIVLLCRMSKGTSPTDDYDAKVLGFFKNPGVATIIAAGLGHARDKTIVKEMLFLLSRIVGTSSNQGYGVLTLADGIFNRNQRTTECLETCQSEKSALELAAETKKEQCTQASIQLNTQKLELQKTTEKHQAEMREMKTKYAAEILRLQTMLRENKKSYEDQLNQLKAHCMSVNEIVTKKLQDIKEKELLLYEARAERNQMAEANNELQKKLYGMESKLEQVAHAHAISKEELTVRDREYSALQLEVEELSELVGKQTSDLDEVRGLLQGAEAKVLQKEKEVEDTYGELVLLGRSHRQVTIELNDLKCQDNELKQQFQHSQEQIQAMKVELEEREEKLKLHEQQIDQLVQKELEYTKTLLEEKSDREAIGKELAAAHATIENRENELATQEIEIGRNRVELEEKQEEIRLLEVAVAQKDKELEEQSKIQEMIHQMTNKSAKK